MNLNFELTDRQKDEFKTAEQFGGSSAEIRKHPEWHPTFMNCFWNGEKQGKGEEYYKIADYIQSHPSKADVQTGKIGSDFEYVYALHNFMEKQGSLDIIPEIPLDESGCVDVTTAKFVLQDYAYRNAAAFANRKKPLYTGRMPLGLDDNTDETKTLMCEGNAEAVKIYDQLESAARSDARAGKLPYGDSFDRGHINAHRIVLDLDEMNIRGQQIVDAYEYAGNSVELMLNCLDRRDPKMAGYVNQKTAERFLADNDPFSSVVKTDLLNRVKFPMAKTSGASFARDGGIGMSFDVDKDWYVNPLNAKELANAGISPIEVDYASLDITEGVDKETGFKIIEARGFEKYFERTVKTAFGEDTDIAFFYNKKTGDVVEVAGAQENNITYAGVTLKTWRDMANWSHDMHSSSGFRNEAGLGYNEYTYHHGLFSEYDKHSDVDMSKQTDRSKLGYQGIGQFPIPDYVHTSARDPELLDALHDKSNFETLKHDNSYHLAWMADIMLAAYDPELKESVCPDYEQLKDDPYHCVMKECGGGWPSDMEPKARTFQFVASWMDMPKEERQKYYDALVDIVQERDEVLKANAREMGRRLDKNELSSGIVKKLSSLYLNDPKCPEDIYAIDIPKIEDTPFADFVPWLDTEAKDFEAAVANISMDGGMEL